MLLSLDIAWAVSRLEITKPPLVSIFRDPISTLPDPDDQGTAPLEPGLSV